MQTALLIAEKPDLMKKIENVYKKHKNEIPVNIVFRAQAGHLVTLLSPKELDEEQKVWSWDNIPFFPEEHGGWRYKIISSKSKYFYDIQKEIQSGKYDFIIHAGDPDKEGELLVRLVLNKIGNKLPVKRFWANATTEEEFLNALKNLQDDSSLRFENLYKSALTRQKADYLFGMNGTQAATLKTNTLTNVGRVKMPILSIICQREVEIKNYKQTSTYEINALYEEDFSATLFQPQKAQDNNSAKENEAETGNIRFSTKKEAEEFALNLLKKGKKAYVEKIEKKKEVKYAPDLFKLSSLQTMAGHYKYTAEKVSEIAESLYLKGYTSYPRTSCQYLSSNMDFSSILNAISVIPEFAPYIKNISNTDIEAVRKNKKWINNKALEESGHYALTPTNMKPNLTLLSKEEREIYTLIARQFLAIFLPPAISDKTTIVIDSYGNKFRTSGKIIKQKGFLELFGKNPSDVILPNLTEGVELNIRTLAPVEKKSTCPKRYTDGELIAVLENPLKFLNDKSLKKLGKKLTIGTEATRAEIIKEMIEKNGYLERTSPKKGNEIIQPTNKGMNIYELLKNLDICKVDMTGQWEEKIQDIQKGNDTEKNVISYMEENVKKLIKDLQNLEVKNNVTSVGKCPLCGKDMIIGKNGLFCTGYKEGCKTGIYKEFRGANITEKDIHKLLEGKIIKKKIFNKDRTKQWEQKLFFNKKSGKLEFYI